MPPPDISRQADAVSEPHVTHIGSAARGPRGRFKVLGFVVSLAAVTYLDRVCIAVTAPSIMRDLGLNQMQMAAVFSAFTIAYMLFEVPTGAWADKIGARRVLTRIVVWWSTFTAATAMAINFPVLLVTRFAFGMGEAGAWPSAARAISRWFPKNERGTAQGVFFMGAHLAGGVTPMLIAAMLMYVKWRTCFAVFAGIGLVWSLCWHVWFRDDPPVAERHLVHTDEPARSLDPRRTPWKAVLTDRSVLALCAMYLTQVYGFYFYITWLPTYLQQARGFSSGGFAIFAGLPLLFSVVADGLGGVVTDAVTLRMGLRAGRVGVGAASFLLASVFMFMGIACSNGKIAVLLISLAAAFSNFTLGAAWAAAAEVGGNHAAVVCAFMNSAGQAGGTLSPLILALCLRRFSSWDMGLYTIAVLYLIGGLCWLFVRPEHKIEDDDLAVAFSHTI